MTEQFNSLLKNKLHALGLGWRWYSNLPQAVHLLNEQPQRIWLSALDQVVAGLLQAIKVCLGTTAKQLLPYAYQAALPLPGPVPLAAGKQAT